MSRGANPPGNSVPSHPGERIRIASGPGGVVVEIRPRVRTRGGRVRLAALVAGVAGAALLGASRLGAAWEAGLRKGEFGDLPLPILVLLSAAVGLGTPIALAGLAALAFAEERVEVGGDQIVFHSTAFERTRTVRIAVEELECWRETYLPLPPWWTWAVRRLAARANGRLHSFAGAATAKEKRAIGTALAKATGKPLVAASGRVVESPSPPTR